MLGDGDRSKFFSRRAAMLAGGKFFLASALVSRMYYLQVLEADKYRMLADENRISLRLLPPPRGRIIDRFGAAMAVNKQNFRATIVSEQAKDLKKTLDHLSHIITLTIRERKRIKRDIKRKRSFVPVTVKENLSWEGMSRIQVNAPDLPGVLIDEGLTRFYPHQDVAAHILGYVAPVSERDLTGDPLLELPGARIGKAGIERVFDDEMRGKGGNRRVEVNAVGRIIRELERNEGLPGADIPLTIDFELQKYVTRRLNGQSGTAIVMDIHTGDILTMASAPAFDPNAFNRGLTSDEWSGLISSPRTPLINKAIAGQYSPGSTFKMVVALAALEAGVVTPEERIYCSGHTDLGNHRFHCWKDEGHGPVNMVGSLQHSCDIYFYEIAKRTGIDRIAKMARRFGLGSSTDVGLPGEKKGLIPTQKWKREALGERWQTGETYNAGIGQGYLLTTPLQLTVMTARLANGGLAVEPRLTLRSEAPKEDADQEASESKKKRPASLSIPRHHLQLVKDGMNAVVNVPGGTAYRSQIRVNGQRMAGKTGTTQVRRISMAEREEGVKDQEELAWRMRNHALFVSYAPTDNPRYAVTVVIEHGGSGSGAAAPVAKDIMAETLRRDPARRPVQRFTETETEEG